MNLLPVTWDLIRADGRVACPGGNQKLTVQSDWYETNTFKSLYCPVSTDFEHSLESFCRKNRKISNNIYFNKLTSVAGSSVYSLRAAGHEPRGSWIEGDPSYFCCFLHVLLFKNGVQLSVWRGPITAKDDPCCGSVLNLKDPYGRMRMKIVGLTEELLVEKAMQTSWRQSSPFVNF